MTPTAESEVTPQRRRRRRWPRRLLIGLGVLAVLVAFTPTWLSLGPAAWILRRQVRAQWPGEVRVGRVTVSWTGGVSARGLFLGDEAGRPVLAVDAVEAHPRLLTLLGGRPALGAVRISKASLTADLSPDGALRRTLDALRRRAAARPPAGPAAVPHLSTDLEVLDSDVEVRVPGGQRPVRLVIRSASAGVDLPEKPITLRLSAQLAGGDVLADGSVTLPREGPLDLGSMEASLKAGAAPEALADLQPLLTALGVPLEVAGSGEFVANLTAKRGAYEAILQVKDARLSLRPAGAAKSTPVYLDTALASLKGLEEPIVFSAEGELAQGRVKARGSVTVPFERPLRAEKVTGALRVEGTALALDELNPLLAAFHMPLDLAGSAALTASALAKDGSVSVAGTLTAKALAVKGDPLGDDQPTLEEVDLRFDLSYDGRLVAVRELALATEPLRGTAVGMVDLTPDTGPQQTKFVAEVTASLPALAAALPRTLGLRKGLAVEKGEIEATASVEQRGTTLDAKGIFRLFDLRGTLDGRAVSLDTPVSVVLDAGLDLAEPGVRGVEVRAAEVRSGFATVRGAGVPDDLHFSLACDLGHLDRTLRQFVDMGQVSLAGRAQAEATLRGKGQDRYAFLVQADLADLVVTGLEGIEVRERVVSAEAGGEADLAGAVWHRLLATGGKPWDVAFSRLKVATTAVTASGSGAVRGVTGPDPRFEGLDLTVTGDLARLQGSLRRLFLPEAGQLAGQFAVHTTGGGTLASFKVSQEVTGADLAADGLTIAGKPVSVRCDEPALEHETTLGLKSPGFRADVAAWSVKSSLVDASGSVAISAGSPLRLERASARVDRLELGPASEGLRAFLPEGLAIRGRLAGTASASESQPGRYRIEADLKTSDLGAEGGPLHSPWAGGDLHAALAADLSPAADGGGLRVDFDALTAETADGQVTVKADGRNWLRTDGAGRVAVVAAGDAARLRRAVKPFLRHVPGEEDLSLSGAFSARLAGDLDPKQLVLQIGELTVRDVTLAGRRVGPTPVREAELALSVAGAWDRAARAVDLTKATIRSTFLTADVTEARAAYDATGLTSARARMAASGELERLSKAFGWVVGLPPDAGLAGQFKMDQELTTRDTLITATGRLPLTDVAWRAGERRVAEPRIDVEYDLAYDTRTRSLAIRKAGVRTARQVVVAAGTIDDLTGRREVDLTVQLDYDAADLSEKLAGLLPADLALVGRRQARIDVQGRAAGGTWREAVKGLVARGQLGLDEVRYAEVVVSQPTLTLDLAAGRLRVGPDRWRVNEGVGEIACEVDLTADPVVITVPKPLEVARNVGFEKRVASEVMKYLCPAFAEVGRTRGALTFAVQDLRLPLGPDWHRGMQMGATARFTGVEVDSSQLLRVILLALRERPTGVVGDIPAFPVAVRDGRFHYGTIRIPVKDFAIELSGSAGFDGTLDLMAAVPLTEGMLGSDVRKYLTGARVRIAISGTFSDPRLDEQALQKAIDGLVRDALKKAAEEEARRLLERWLDGRRPPP